LVNANVKSAEWQLKASQLEIATQVKQVYWQLAYLYSKQRLYNYQDSLYSGVLRAEELRAKVGETNRLEMINARTQSLEVKNQMQQVTADLSIYNQKLQSLLNTNSAITPLDTMLQRIEFSPIADSLSIAGNPSLGFAHQQVEISRFEKKLEQSRMMPDFSVGYFSQTMQGILEVNGMPRTFGSGDRLTGIQAGIAIPLWFFSNTAKTRSARLKELVSQTDAANYSKSLSGNYRSLIGEYTKYRNSVDYYEMQAIPEANLIIDQAMRSFKAGAMDYLEYIHNLDQALSIRKNYLEAMNSYNQTIISIDFITGKIF
jgi:cobalt-zinc-cadmium resistance protein CzcA